MKNSWIFYFIRVLFLLTLIFREIEMYTFHKGGFNRPNKLSSNKKDQQRWRIVGISTWRVVGISTI